jgi:hypothetical protein
VWNRQEDDAGRLSFMRIHLSQTTFVNHYHLLGNLKDSYKVAKGDENLTSQFPESLAGVTHLLGREIPFCINFEEEAEKIIALSNLTEFTIACGQARSASTCDEEATWNLF